MKTFSIDGLPGDIQDKIKVATTGCWWWTASKDSGGYGKLQRNKKFHCAHRYVYELLVGPIPDGLHMDHLCNNRACVNPAHLEPVSRSTNQLRSPNRFKRVKKALATIRERKKASRLAMLEAERVIVETET